MDAHKDPRDRAHLWERPRRVDEHPPAAIDPHFPRHVHRTPETRDPVGGAWKEVRDQAALDEALAAGWSLTPAAE